MNKIDERMIEAAKLKYIDPKLYRWYQCIGGAIVGIILLILWLIFVGMIL